jgi:hypothetical protein
VVPLLREELGFLASHLGILLVSFFWTYASFKLLSGSLVDSFRSTGVMAEAFFFGGLSGSHTLLSAISAMVCGRPSDRWMAAGESPTRVRKTFTRAGVICAGIFIALFCDCQSFRGFVHDNEYFEGPDVVETLSPHSDGGTDHRPWADGRDGKPSLQSCRHRSPGRTAWS